MTDLLSTGDLLTFHPLSVDVVIAMVLTVGLLLLSGFASGSEIAFFSLSPQDLDELQPEKKLPM